jgi:hypothetical protein
MQAAKFSFDDLFREARELAKLAEPKADFWSRLVPLLLLVAGSCFPDRNKR